MEFYCELVFCERGTSSLLEGQGVMHTSAFIIALFQSNVIVVIYIVIMQEQFQVESS